MLRNLRILLLAGLLSTLIAAMICPACADFDPRDWQYCKSIKTRAGRAQYGQVILDGAVYCNSQRDLSDLRLIDGRGREVPYKLLVDRAIVEDAVYPPTMLNKSVVSGKYSSFVLDLGKTGRENNQVVIDTSSTNFTRKVEIEGSQDAIKWETLRNDAYIFDFSRDYQASSTAVSYPNNVFRYVRVKIWNYDEKPIQITGANVHWRKVQPAKEILFYRGTGVITQNSEERSTDILVDLGCSGLPAGRFVLESPDTNYHRRVEIAGSKDRKMWTDLCEGHILKYDTPKFKGRESSIRCANAGYRYILVRIRNYDDQPIRISDVRFYGIRHRIFFPFEPNARYRLFYGNAEAHAPVYDIEQAFKYLSTESAAMASLASQTKNPDFRMPIATRPWLEKNPWILWAVLGAAVVLLGLLTIRLIIQTKQESHSE